MKKDVVYIDIEDDITAIIDKVKASKAGIIALVPPKRSGVLQSVVNMKLLERSARDAKKKLVLITNEDSLLALAGGLDMHVAKNLQSKPYVPDFSELEQADGDAVISGDDLKLEASPAQEPKSSKEESEAPKEKLSKKKSKDIKPIAKKKIKVPNFDRFRKKVVLGGALLLILLIGGWFALVQMPKATIALQAQTSRIDTEFDFTIAANLTEDDFEALRFKAVAKEVKKTVSETFSATGEENVGEKASGLMTIQNCDSSKSVSIPSGTRFTSTGGLVFVMGESVSVPGGTFGGGGCTSPGEVTIEVTANEAGDNYNLAAGSTYKVSGQSTLITGYGGKMSGGTTEIAKVISQEDVDAAAQKLSANDEDARQELSAMFGESMIAFPETFTLAKTDPTSEPAVGEKAAEGAVSAQYIYTMLGIERETLVKAVETFQNDRITDDQQSIYNNGIDEATFQHVSSQSNSDMTLKIRANGFVGPQFDIEKIAQDISGKRYSEVVESLERLPGVNNVDVSFSPFWVNKAPKASKIDISLDVSEHTLQ